MTRRTAGLDELAPPRVMISPEDAEALRVKEGATVEVSTRRGAIRIRARISPQCPRGTIFIPFHFHEAPANRLTIPALDGESKIPEYKVCAARIQRLGPALDR
jgi:formate dehydrogenase major subunit